MAFTFDDPKIGQCSVFNAPVIFNNLLCVFGPTGSSDQLYISGFALSNLNSNATLPVPSASDWQSMAFAVNSTYSNLNTKAGVAAVGAGTDLYVFWQDSKGLMAAQISDSTLDFGDDKASKPWFQLLRMDGTSLSNNVDVTASQFDSDDIIVATLLLSSNEVYVGQFQISALPTIASGSSEPGAWQAYNEWTFDLAQLGGSSSWANIGTNLSADWYSPDGKTFWYVFALLPQYIAGDWYPGIYCASIDAISMPYMQVTFNGGVPFTGGSNFVSQSGNGAPFSIRRDPAGRLRIYNAPYMIYSVGITTQPGNADPPSDTADALTFVWTSMTEPDGETSLTPPTTIAPASVFLVGSQNLLTTVEKDPTVQDPTQLANATTNAVSEVIFLPDQNWEIMCFSQPYGRIQQVASPPATLTSGNTGSTTTVIIRGIVDGPIPIPNQNAFAVGTGGTDCGDLVYGSLIENQTERTLDVKMACGVTSSGHSGQGVGPAWQISLSAGMGGSASTLLETETILNTSCSALLDKMTPYEVTPNGYVFASAANFVCGVYRFLLPANDGTDNFTVDGNSSTYLGIYPQLQDSEQYGASIQFVPYTVQPGDLTTYTRSAWNSRMQELGYQGASYFETEILPNAYPFAENQPYLEYVWAAGSLTAPQATVMQTNVNETSWTFDSSVYAGISLGYNVLVASGNYSFLAGISLDLSGSSTTTQLEQWGIAISNPKIPTVSDSYTNTPYVIAYTFRVYFLPASIRWCQELIKYYDQPRTSATNSLLYWMTLSSGAMVIDPNSQPWRIVYEVVSFTTCDPTQQPPTETVFPGPAPSAPSAPSFIMMEGQLQWEYVSTGTIWSNVKQVKYGVTFASGVPNTYLPPITESEMSALSPAGTVGTQMCPELAIPVDSSNWAVARNVYRVFDEGSPVLVLTIPDNTSTMCYDNNPTFNFAGPSEPIAGYDPSNWAGRSNLANSLVWIPNNIVTYSVTFVFSMGNTAQSVERYGETLPGPDGPSITVTLNSEPMLTGVPISNDAGDGGNTPTCLARNIYRVCTDANGLVQGTTLVAQIPDNTTTQVADLFDSQGLSLTYDTAVWP